MVDFPERNLPFEKCGEKHADKSCSAMNDRDLQDVVTGQEDVEIGVVEMRGYALKQRFPELHRYRSDDTEERGVIHRYLEY